jgi:hypothetical protein
MIVQDYSVTGDFNPYIVGAKIIDTFVLSKDITGSYSDRGSALIFEKDDARGILICGYNDIGEWIDFLQVGNNVIHDNTGYFEKPYRTSQLTKEYRITGNAE